MEAIEAILHRRSIRKYTGEKISDEQIELLLKAAMYAPSAVNKQPWHFIVFKDAKTKKQIMEFHKSAAMLAEWCGARNGRTRPSRPPASSPAKL